MNLWVVYIGLFYVSNTLELITNPDSSPVICGLNDDCTVICDASSACNSFSFYFYNHTIHLECSKCDYARIYTSNVKSFTLEANMFMGGFLFSSPTDTNISVVCADCENALFYYLNTGQSEHICTGSYGCRKTTIDAVSGVSLQCQGYYSCFFSVIILPPNPLLTDQSSITVSGSNQYATASRSLKVYSLYPFTNFISLDGTNFDAIHFVYGIRFDKYCVVSDTSCMDAISIDVTEYNDLSVVDTYVHGDPASTYDGDLLIFASLSGETFTAPTIPDANTLSIVCLRCWVTIFQLGTVQNAVLSDGSCYMWYSTIYGPQNVFQVNTMSYTSTNEYQLIDTQTVIINSLGSNAKVYLGNASDVHINCQKGLYYGCGNANSNIWSTLQQHEIQLAHARTGYWDIDTPSALLIHFDFELYACEFLNYVSNCSFLFYPTAQPTEAPTEITDVPTSATSRPTMNPTISPTDVPTELTNDPTISPYTSPTHAPNNAPSYTPTSAPTSAPTYTPSRAPTDNETMQRDSTNYTVIILLCSGLVMLLLIAISVFFYKKLDKVSQNESAMADVELEQGPGHETENDKQEEDTEYVWAAEGVTNGPEPHETDTNRDTEGNTIQGPTTTDGTTGGAVMPQQNGQMMSPEMIAAMPEEMRATMMQQWQQFQAMWAQQVSDVQSDV
eukprot:217392_1